MDDALAKVQALDRGFVHRRITHFKSRPDQREAASRLDDALTSWFNHGKLRSIASPVGFDAVAAPAAAIGFDDPESFLHWVSGRWDGMPVLDLDQLRYVEAWAIVALGSLCNADRPTSPKV